MADTPDRAGDRPAWIPDPDTFYRHADGRTMRIPGLVTHHYLDSNGELWANLGRGRTDG